MGQIEIAANFALAELKSMPDAVRQGRQAIPCEPATAPVVETEPAPEATRPAAITPAARDPIASAEFQVIDCSAETRTLTIEVPRL